MASNLLIGEHNVKSTTVIRNIDATHHFHFQEYLIQNNMLKMMTRAHNIHAIYYYLIFYIDFVAEEENKIAQINLTK